MRIRKTSFASTPLILLVFAGHCRGAQRTKPSLERLMDSLLAVREFKEVAISPEGRRVAWVEALREENGAPSENSVINVADLEPSPAPPRRISAGSGGAAHAEHDIAWSPDGRQLAFLSDAANGGQLDLYVADTSGGPARRLTHLTGFLARPLWSPDGKRLAILFTENAPRAAGPLQPMTKDAGVVDQHIYEQRLTTVDLDSGRARPISPPDLYVYEYDWSPDGKIFIATAAHGAGDANWYIAELFTISSLSGEIKSIYKPSVDTQLAVPRWSPDGKSIAFIGGLMSDEGNTGGDIFTLPSAGGEPRNLTPNLQASPAWLTWLSSKQILFTEQVDGSNAIATLDPVDGRIVTLWSGEKSISTGGWSFGLALARDATTSALVLESFNQPPEVWAGAIGSWRQVTNSNRNAQPSWGKAESFRWSSEGKGIQGWLLYPRDYDSSRRYPLVVEVHGGPGSMVRSRWPKPFFDLSLLSEEGFFVLFPNPRGSFGKGESFTRANVKDFGYGDFRDILAGVDEVVRTLPVDNDRVGIGGWSYGGFMTMWGVTQTNRFRAAVAGAGISNWQSYYGENDIDLWMIPFFGASVYDNPAVYARSSPITFIKNSRTPTLILVGDSDGECPPPQSYEFWHALKTLGVETQFVIYANEGHDIAQPEDRRDIARRAVAWFDHYLK